MIKLTCLQKKIWKINYFNTLSIHVQHLWYNASTKIRKYFIQNDVSSLYRFSILKSAKKILFTSLNYGLSLRFYLKLKNWVFCLLELAKPDILPLFVVFLAVFLFSFMFILDESLKKNVVNHKKIIKWKIKLCSTPQ